MFRQLRSKGALFIEYALILAFVIGIGGLFVSNNSLPNSIAGIFEKTNNIIDQATKPKKTVAEKNEDLMRYLLERIAAKFTGVSGTTNDNALKGYIGKNDQKLMNGTDSDCVDLKDCFAKRWKADDPAQYNAIVDDISYTFYANKQIDGSYTWTVYFYNPENNGGKKLADYDKDYIRSDANSIKTEVYEYNDGSKLITYIGTEDKKVTSHRDKAKNISYNVIRDTGVVE